MLRQIHSFGVFFFIFDGLDEISSENRYEFILNLKYFSSHYEKNGFLLDTLSRKGPYGLAATDCTDTLFGYFGTDCSMVGTVWLLVLSSLLPLYGGGLG